VTTAAIVLLKVVLLALTTQPACTPSLATYDRAVIEAVGRHLLAGGRFPTNKEEAARSNVVLENAAPKGPVLVPCASDCVEQGRELPPWALQALKTRNDSMERSAFRWESVCPRCRAPILVVDNMDKALLEAADPSLGELRFLAVGSEETFARAFPEARGWLAAFLPGYSPDCSQAIVRAWVGPSPHGSLATALLRRRGDEWLIEWCDIVHFS
jgi:hypothetical protein